MMGQLTTPSSTPLKADLKQFVACRLTKSTWPSSPSRPPVPPVAPMAARPLDERQGVWKRLVANAAREPSLRGKLEVNNWQGGFIIDTMQDWYNAGLWFETSFCCHLYIGEDSDQFGVSCFSSGVLQPPVINYQHISFWDNIDPWIAASHVIGTFYLWWPALKRHVFFPAIFRISAHNCLYLCSGERKYDQSLNHSSC